MAKQIFSSIIDEFLDDREPDWDQVGLKDAEKSGEKQLDRTHQYVDKKFLDEIAEGKSEHTQLPPTSRSATLLNRLSEKEAAAPRLGGAQKAATPVRLEDYKNERGDDESLFAEVTMALEEAEKTAPESKQQGVGKRNRSDQEILGYVKALLNQGTPPAHVAAQLKKLAEIELFNKKDNMGMNYLNQNAGLLGLAYLEPNAYMDKSNPNYEREKVGSEKKPFCVKCNKDVDAVVRDANSYCPHCASILTLKPKSGSLAQRRRVGSSVDCVRQSEAWKAAGIKPRAKSVKKIAACEGCAFFKNKACGLYHLPVVANAEELRQVVNHLTPGIPASHKRAALVKIANRQPERAEGMAITAAPPRPIMKTSERTIENLREGHQQVSMAFDASTVERLHKAGHSLEKIYQAGIRKAGSATAGSAVRAFVASLRGKGTKVVLSQVDCRFLKQKLGVSNSIIGAAKCADCSYRRDMHCGLTGGTLLSFPGMEKTGKTASAPPEDPAATLRDYELTGRPKQADIGMDEPERLDVQMGSVPSAGDL